MELKKILKAGLAKDVARRFKEQYIDSSGKWLPAYPGRKEIHERILLSKSAAAVEEAIGNRTWTNFSCNECEQRVERVIEFGRYDHKEPICKGCLEKALELIGD